MLQIRRLLVEQKGVQWQIMELNMVKEILDTTAWTAEDLELVRDARHSRMD